MSIDNSDISVGRIFTISSLKSVIIKSLFETIKPYIKECTMMITPEFIKISTLDIAKESVTYVKLNASKFERYYCKKAVMVGIDTATFFKAIKSTNRKETITFYMDEAEPDKLGIELRDSFMGKVKDYKLNLLELDEKVFKVEDMEFDYIINMPTVQFQQIIKDIHLLDGKIVEIKSVGKQVIFTCNDGIAKFRTSISELDDNLNKEQKALLQQNGEDVKSIKFSRSTDHIVQGRFKMSYLLNFIKASHLCENMNILLANDKPLVLEYFVADLGCLRLLLVSSQDEQ
jgi:proliferating cell nuclear antigen